MKTELMNGYSTEKMDKADRHVLRNSRGVIILALPRKHFTKKRALEIIEQTKPFERR